MERVSLIVPSPGIIDLDDMLRSLGDNRFFEIIVCIDLMARSYLPVSKKANLDLLKELYPFVKWYENPGEGSIVQTVNVALEHAGGEWIWITHDDILFPKSLAPHPGYRYDLRLDTEINKRGVPENVKCLMFHYTQLLNNLDTRIFAHEGAGGYVTSFGGGGGYTGISSIIHRSVIESIEGYGDCKGFDLKCATYYDTQISIDSEVGHWVSLALHDAPNILHKVSRSGLYTSNCNDFERIQQWRHIPENAKKWRDYVYSRVRV